MELKNDLWDFALNFYQQPGVEVSCLRLQDDYGLSINRLIYACWCASCGIRVQTAWFSGEAGQWQQSITHPLREVRYRVRQPKQTQTELDRCYQALRKAELACEQVELALLFEQTPTAAEETRSVQLVLDNLVAYLEFAQVRFDSETELLLGPILSASNHYLALNPPE